MIFQEHGFSSWLLLLILNKLQTPWEALNQAVNKRGLFCLPPVFLAWGRFWGVVFHSTQRTVVKHSGTKGQQWIALRHQRLASDIRVLGIQCTAEHARAIHCALRVLWACDPLRSCTRFTALYTLCARTVRVTCVCALQSAACTHILHAIAHIAHRAHTQSTRRAR